MRKIQEQEFSEKSEDFLYGPRIANQFYAAVSIQKFILFSIKNFKRVFLKSTFFNLMGNTARKLFDQSTYPGART